MTNLGIRRDKNHSRPARTRGWRFSLLATAVCAGLLFSVSPSPIRAAERAAIEALVDAGQYAQAIEAATKALAANEYDPTVSVLKIRAELATGAYPEALASLEAATKRYPTSLAVRLIGRDVYLLNNRPEDAEKQLLAIQSMAQQTPWRYSDAANRVLIGRALLLAGADPREVLEMLYDKARKDRPEELDAYVASAELALEKSDDALAAQTLAKAIKLAPNKLELHFLLAKALASAVGERSDVELEKVLEANPRHVPSLLMQIDARLDDENIPAAEKLLDRVIEVNPREPTAWAYRAVLAHLAGDAKTEEAHRLKALEPWPTNPRVDHLIGRRLARNYRFKEAAACQRRALQLAPDFLPAKIQLSQDLLRLGEEEEGWRLADEAFEGDGYNVVAHNLTTLHEALAKYRTLETPGFVVRMDAREADIYGDRVLELLRLAREALCRKYEVELSEPVIVEIFAEQKDFAIRTFGLPGGAGFLGVCFGRVVTANSPASQGQHPANWQAVLWHEFCHVITLTKTRNKMPRWLSEGISVYEERQRDPTWGQAIRPEYRERLLAQDLAPVSKLSSSFLKPRTPLDLQFAYFESFLVVEYLVGKYGLPALTRILLDLADDVPINQALARHTEKMEQLDADFAAYARTQAEAFAPGTDWSELKLPPEADLAALARWNKEHSRNYQGLKRQAEQLVEMKKWSEAKPVIVELATIYPTAALPLLARVHRELNEAAEERATLEKLAGLANDATPAFSRLMEVAATANDWPAVEQNARRMLAVNPLVPGPYRQMAQAAESLGHLDEAIAAQRVLLLLDPSDPSESHYRLARLLVRKKDLPAARRHVLQSLEETPRYQAAQRLLLEIVESSDAGSDHVGSGKGEASNHKANPVEASPGKSNTKESP